MKRYDEAHTIAARHPVSIATPRRSLSVAEDVVVPLAQALVSGLMLAVLVTGILWGFLGLDFAKTFMASLGLGLAVSWLWRLDVVTQTLWIAEEFAHVDLDGDGSVGKPRHAMRVEIAKGLQTSYVDIAGLDTLEELRRFAILGVTGRLNERAVGRAFDWPRADWQAIRDELIRRGLVTWNGREGSTQGVGLTDEGEEVMRAIIDSPSPTA